MISMGRAAKILQLLNTRTNTRSGISEECSTSGMRVMFRQTIEGRMGEMDGSKNGNKKMKKQKSCLERKA